MSTLTVGLGLSRTPGSLLTHGLGLGVTTPVPPVTPAPGASSLLTVGLGLSRLPGSLLTHGLGLGGVTPPEPPVTPVVTIRDRQILKRFAEKLVERDRFHEVGTAGLPEQKGASAEHYRKVSMDVRSFVEVPRWSEPGRGLTVERVVDFALVIHVRDADPDVRDDEADRLYVIAANTISQEKLDSQLVQDKTWLNRGRYLLTDGIERRIECTGQFTYLIEGRDGRAEASDYPL
jgi:hypothetical protein